VKGYNCNKATKEFDIWTIVLAISLLEGNSLIYDKYFIKPIKKLLINNICVP